MGRVRLKFFELSNKWSTHGGLDWMTRFHSSNSGEREEKRFRFSHQPSMMAIITLVHAYSEDGVKNLQC